jgi:hypothetical protein
VQVEGFVNESDSDSIDGCEVSSSSSFSLVVGGARGDFSLVTGVLEGVVAGEDDNEFARCMNLSDNVPLERRGGMAAIRTVKTKMMKAKVNELRLQLGFPQRRVESRLIRINPMLFIPFHSQQPLPTFSPTVRLLLSENPTT